MPLASTLILVLLSAAPTPGAAEVAGPRESGGKFLALCYHDIVSRRSGDPRAVEEVAFVRQIEFLRSQGAHFASVDELLEAKEGKRELAPRSVMLSFDDGCKSFHRRVLPVLEHYRIPAVLSVVTAWSDEVTSSDCEGGVMSWREIAEVAGSGLVEIGSHSHDLHRSVQINPMGSMAPATSRRFDATAGAYESEAQQRQRIARDLRLSARVLQARLGKRPRVLTWPFGAYNALSLEEARRAGFSVVLTLRDDLDGGIASVSNLEEIPRRMLEGHPSLELFARDYWAGGPAAKPRLDPPARRVVHADLDLLYDPDAEVQRRNIDRFIDRMLWLKPSTVYLQAFADDSGTGNVSAVYFPNRVLPMKADLFSFVARALQGRDLHVLAWMPSLSFLLPDARLTESLRVRERHEGRPRPARNAYRRLSPFSEEARQRIATLFEDLAMAAPIDGILFQDDAFLDEEEDFHPAALPALRALGIDPVKRLSPPQKEAWTARKVQALIDWTGALMAAVRRHRPDAQSARTLYAPVLIEPESERWFAQSYAASLQAYDEVVVMAYPLMEKIEDPLPWLGRLVAASRAAPLGLAKTVFKLQTVDWSRHEACVPADTLVLWMRTLLSDGARHLAYYPDNVFENCPRRESIRNLVSTEDFPVHPEAAQMQQRR